MNYKQNEAIAKLNTLEVGTPVLITFNESLSIKQLALFAGQGVNNSKHGYNFLDKRGKFFFSEIYISVEDKISFDFENIDSDELAELIIKVQNQDF